MTVKNINHDELAKLRKGAPARTKLSVSRPARRYHNPVTYQGTGNTFAYVTAVLGHKPDRQLMQRINNATDYSGILPDAITIQNWAR